MTSTMTYDSLKQDIGVYCERDDAAFVTQVPRFIMMAENRLASELKTLGFLRTTQGTLNGNTLVKPTRWRTTKSFSLLVGATRQYLMSREYEFCRKYWPDQSLQEAPRYYADYDYEHFFIAPTPNMPYMFEMQYYERPEPLSETNQTNWTTQYAPQLLLYASLMEAMPFLKSSERIAEFQMLYDRAAQMVTKEDSERIMDSAATRKL